jgi:hypothetical protein
MGGLWNNFKPGSGASFTVTAGFMKATTSPLKSVSGRIFKIRECFQRNK